MDKKPRRQESDSTSDSHFFSSNGRREATGFFLIATAVILFTSLILNPSQLRGIATSEMPSAAGKFGRWIAGYFGIFFGFGSLLFPMAIGAWGVAIIKNYHLRTIFARGLALIVGLISSCAFLGLIYDGGYLGGAIGDRLSHDLYQTFGIISYIVVFFAGIISLSLATPFSFVEIGAALLSGSGIAWAFTVKAYGHFLSLYETLHAMRAPASSRPESADPATAALKSVAPKAAVAEAAKSERDYFEKAEMRIVPTSALKLVTAPLPVPVAQIEAPKKAAVPFTLEKNIVEYTPDEDFTLPPMSILDDPAPASESVTEEDLKLKAQGLQATLEDFGVECKVGEIIAGPTVTRFEIIPAPGVKISSITARADDIALAMAAPSIRIEAPIPGKAAVGIEIPNRKARKVALKEVLASDEFQAVRAKSVLAVALGQDIAGRPIIADLRRMPHLLIAGATGSGKSVCINSIINSILLSASPTEVKMLMVDPKVVELQEYDGVPHLLAPVVTDVRKAPKVLMWAVQEMERRYQFLARAGVRDIESYNTLAPASAGGEADVVDEFIDIESELPPLFDASGMTGAMPDRMPYIVMVVDEFGDLMMVAAKECEDCIIRIAQMARAVGIHLIIATQRPSVDVITGIIKANLPSRIAFQVSSKIDSRTILDVMGAEKLLGYGDMLYKPGDRPKPMRVQGNFIGGREIKDIITHYSSQGKARRQLTIDDQPTDMTANALIGEDDPLLGDAMRICFEDGMASVSRIQRRLKIGHPRAARLVDIMEAKGLVTPPDGSKPRKLLYDESFLTK